MNNYPLTLDTFRSWLESKEENEIVGWQGWCKGCPIFKCLKEKNQDVYSVNYESTFFIHRDDFLLNPHWVKSFINKIDDRSIVPLKQGEINASVTAKQALEVLNSKEVLDNMYVCTKCNKYNPEGKNCGKEDCDW